MAKTTTEPALFTIFGATGDLSKRKLLPSLFKNYKAGHLNKQVFILGVSLEELTDEEFRTMVQDALSKAGFESSETDSFIGHLHYQTIGSAEQPDYLALKARIKLLEREHQLPQNRVFYLSLPPRIFTSTIKHLGEVGLNESKGWTRLVIEKPFGKDLASARELNKKVHAFFNEDQVYRIDHYLGKETVQNLLVFRLANAFIESSWNRDRIESVQITVAESLGVGSRAGYYDHAGALRDMVQNHLTQLMTVLAMEVPVTFNATAIRYEKLKILQSIKPIHPKDAVRGRYMAGSIDGEEVPGYMQEDGVSVDSSTETFVALNIAIDNWRWQGVPFYLRTGKRMPLKTTKVQIRFRETPITYFESMGCKQDTADILTITLQPNEGFSFYFDIKIPGEPLQLKRVPFHFNYDQAFASMPDAYQTLLLDVIQGDQTLFVHADEVEASWKIYQPLLENPPPLCAYPAGSWGPAEAARFAIPESELWQRE